MSVSSKLSRNGSTQRLLDAYSRTHPDQAEPAGPDWKPPTGHADGRDRDRVGAGPDKGILDTQPGSDRNGRE